MIYEFYFEVLGKKWKEEILADSFRDARSIFFEKHNGTVYRLDYIFEIAGDNRTCLFRLG